jgi:hypothetical protein
MPDDHPFIRQYVQHLDDPAVRIRRHIKFARQLGIDPRELIDPDPALQAAVEEYLRAEQQPRR